MQLLTLLIPMRAFGEDSMPANFLLVAVTPFANCSISGMGSALQHVFVSIVHAMNLDRRVLTPSLLILPPPTTRCKRSIMRRESHQILNDVLSFVAGSGSGGELSLSLSERLLFSQSGEQYIICRPIG